MLYGELAFSQMGVGTSVTHGRRGSTDDLEDGGTEANGTDPTRFFNVKSSASGKGVTAPMDKQKRDSQT